MTELLEGKKSILEALRAGRPLSKIFIAKNIERHQVVAEILHLAKQKGIVVEWIEREYLNNVSPAGKHQGMVASTSPKEYVEVEDLLDEAKTKEEEPLLLVLDEIQDPHNLGAILRSAEGAGVHGIIISKRRAAQLSSSVAKASAGAIEHIPVTRVANISDTLEKLKEKGLWIIGLDEEATQEYTQIDYKGGVAIVVGSEGKGLGNLVKEHCDFLVKIPMKGKISSLNVSVATAIVIFEVVKQRRK